MTSRRLHFSPRWQGLSVVFDARSGDFWIVSSAVRDILAEASHATDPAPILERLPTAARASLADHDIIRISREP